MKASYKFLKRYVPDLDIKGKEFAEKITLTGTKIETYEELDKNLSNIVVGQIKQITKHPNADKLLICQVDIGKEITQIVTGAQNVYEGMLVPVVLSGGKVAASAHDNNNYENGITIKSGKLRGEESNGMLCSIDELGRPKMLYDDVDGILDLKDIDCKVGDDCIKALELDDVLYDFEITSNRIDCYSIVGVAREVSATFDKSFLPPEINYKSAFNDNKYINIEVKNDTLCPLFATAYIKNIKIKESPNWLKNALRAVGIRPINNIVDITNFVMVELGQPMHAYDYDTIKDKKIIVKCADKNQNFVTLDGQTRQLDDTMLTINDNGGIIGLAGIMGGENSMITNNCKNLLLEAANFNGTNIRLSSKKLGMRTEASNLFEKGLDANNAIIALKRALYLINLLDCGEVCEDIIINKNDKLINKVKTISVSVDRVNSLLGTNIDASTMKTILDKIDLKTTINNNELDIVVPTNRTDINNFSDIAEEVLRFYGYDKVGETIPNTNTKIKVNDSIDFATEKAYNIAIFNGFNEAMNYSFESKKVYDNLNYRDDAIERNYIKILNPLGEDFAIMRTQLVNGMLTSLSTNYNLRNKEAKLFEIANVYLPKDKDINVLPDEKKTFILGGYGKDLDFYTFKGYVEEYFSLLGIYYDYHFVKNKNIEFMHPGRTADIVYKNVTIGYVGEVHEKILKSYEIDTKCYLIVINIDELSKYIDFNVKYKEISKYPVVERDLSMLVPNNYTLDNVKDIISKKSGKLLLELNLFDIYEGEQVKSGYKSMAFNIVLGAKDHTLVDTEIDETINKIIKALNDANIELRQ